MPGVQAEKQAMKETEKRIHVYKLSNFSKILKKFEKVLAFWKILRYNHSCVVSDANAQKQLNMRF